MEERYDIAKSDVMQPRSTEFYVDMVSVWARKNRRTYHTIREVLSKEARDPRRWVYKRDKDGVIKTDENGKAIVAYVRPVTRDDLYNLAMRHNLGMSMAAEFRRDHNVWATLSRVCIMADPAIAHIVHPRRTQKHEINRIDIKAIWQRHNPRDDFYADTWQEAADMAQDFFEVNRK